MHEEGDGSRVTWYVEVSSRPPDRHSRRDLPAGVGHVEVASRRDGGLTEIAQMNEDVEFAVVGGGLLGLATARALARGGHEVLVIERDSVGNERAGSKGSARIFRFGYDDPFYVGMALLIAADVARARGGVGTATCCLSPGSFPSEQSLDVLADAMTAAGAPFELLDRQEAARRVPALQVDVSGRVRTRIRRACSRPLPCGTETQFGNIRSRGERALPSHLRPRRRPARAPADRERHSFCICCSRLCGTLDSGSA